MKLTAAVNDLMGRIDSVLQEDAGNTFMLEQLFRMKEDLVDPAVHTLKTKPRFRRLARLLQALYAAVEEYVVWFVQEPEKREERHSKVVALKAQVRRVFFQGKDRESEVEELVDDFRKWQWKTSVDEQGRIVFTTGTGAVVPGRKAIAKDVGIKVIEQAIKAQKPYSDRLRPRDIAGNPGGLIRLNEGKRAIIVGDLHGRYDNLEHILKDKNNLQDILSGETHLIFTGDAIHPRSSLMNNIHAYEDSFCVMLLIMTLKAENPFNVHYLLGNHDQAHVGGHPAGRGTVRQDVLFQKYVTNVFGEQVFARYCQFVGQCPVVAKLKTGSEWLLVVHAGLTPNVLSEQGLINIFIKGPQGPELQDLLWSRDYGNRKKLEHCLKKLGVKFVIAGHTNPVQSSVKKYGISILAEGVFAHVHGLQLIMNAQRNTFGYLDVDLSQALPHRVTSLIAPDGKPACRVLRPRSVAAV